MALWLGAELESSFELIGRGSLLFFLVKPQVPFGSKTVVDWFTSSEWGEGIPVVLCVVVVVWGLSMMLPI